MDKKEGLLKIGEFAKMTKLSVSYIRFLEKEKVLMPTLICDNGYRFYSYCQIDDAEKIRKLYDCGLVSKEIKMIFDGEDMATVVREKYGKMQEEKELLEQRMSRAAELLDYDTAAENQKKFYYMKQLNEGQFSANADVYFDYMGNEICEDINIPIDPQDSWCITSNALTVDVNSCFYEEIINKLRKKYLDIDEVGEFEVEFSYEIYDLLDSLETAGELIELIIKSVIRACWDFQGLFEGKGKSASHDLGLPEFYYVLRRTMHAIFPFYESWWEEYLSDELFLEAKKFKLEDSAINDYDTLEYRDKIFDLYCGYYDCLRCINDLKSQCKYLGFNSEVRAQEFVLDDRRFYLAPSCERARIALYAYSSVRNKITLIRCYAPPFSVNELINDIRKKLESIFI